MKYQILRFQSEQEFQNFFGQLASAEIPNFQAVEGSAGDGGFDGISNETAYQVYYPEDKNRTAANYKSKINSDIDKVLVTSKKLGLKIQEWILIVPEDLSIEVVAFLQLKSKEKGINCIYWGATKLTELVTKFPYIQDSFPLMFLPPVRDGIEDIKKSIDEKDKPRVLTTVEIIGDTEFLQKRKFIQDDYREKTNSFMRSNGTLSSAYLSADKLVKELQIKKDKSDRAYQMELDEINEFYEEQIISVNEDMARRGLISSGIKDNAIGKVKIQHNRAIERLKLKYGKENVVVEPEQPKL